MRSRQDTVESYRIAHAEAAKIGPECYDDVRRHLAKTDLFYLLTVILGRGDANRDWIYERCREVEAAPNGHLDLWSREHYKSTIITYALTIKDILNDPDITVGIFSFNRPIAKSFLRQIKYEFESNDDLRALFSDIIWDNPHRDAPKWSEDDGIVVKRSTNPKESTIEAWGLTDGQPTSKHFRLMVYDDAVTMDSVTTPDMIEKVINSWANSRNLSTEGGHTRYIGTRWAYADLYRTILDRGAAIERRHPVTKDGTFDGEPVLLSRERVAEKRREMGPYVFSSQMLLDPAADRVQGFREEWIRYYEGGGDYSAMNKYILVDPANAKLKKSDYTAMMVIGLSADENYYLLDMVRDRLSLTERADALFSLHRRWKPLGVGYERYGMMADIDYVMERQARENYRFGIVEVGGQIPKRERIRRLIPLYENGRFLLPEQLFKVDYEGKHVDLVQSFLNEEYRPFPVGLHDDMFDAMSRIWDIETMWPKARERRVQDRYARDVFRNRPQSAWAA